MRKDYSPRDEERRFASQKAELESSLVVELRSEVDAAVTFHAGASNGGIVDAAVYAMLTRRMGCLQMSASCTVHPRHRWVPSSLALHQVSPWIYELDGASTLHEHRQAALQYVRRVKPSFMVGSPECTQFSQLQHLDGRVWNARRAELPKDVASAQGK